MYKESGVDKPVKKGYNIDMRLRAGKISEAQEKKEAER